MSSNSNLFIDFMSGGISGVIAKTICAPMERVKLLIQTASSNTALKTPYTGVLNCFQRCITEDGFISLWRGNGANVLRYFPTQAINFCLKDKLKEVFNPFDGKKNPIKFTLGNILSGAMAGSIGVCFVYPLDFCRTRLAADLGKGKQRQFNGLQDCMKQIFVKEGFSGLYRGFCASLVGIFVYRGLYFGLYDSGKYFLFGEKESSVYLRLLFAQIVVISSETISYPTDTVRRLLMMQSGKEIKEYNGQLDTYRKVYNTQGIAAFWKGNISNIYRGMGSAMVLVFYDEIQKLLKKNTSQ